MRAVVQRVSSGRVTAVGELFSKIDQGLVCLIGICSTDTQADLDYIARKLLNMRLWPTEKKARDASVTQQNYELLCVSQFTLHGRLKGNKPDFSRAMAPQSAREFYDGFLQTLRRQYSREKVK